jgi:hypothetical protein
MALTETSLVKVRLISKDKEHFNDETGTTVSGAEILNQLTVNNIWRTDKTSRYAPVTFNGRTYKFREGMSMTVPDHLASMLRRGSAIVVGSDSLNGPIVPFLELTEHFDITQLHADKEKVPAVKTACPVCGVDQKTLPALARHIMKDHAEANEPSAPKARIDWDGKFKGAPDSTDGE